MACGWSQEQHPKRCLFALMMTLFKIMVYSYVDSPTHSITSIAHRSSGRGNVGGLVVDTGQETDSGNK